VKGGGIESGKTAGKGKKKKGGLGKWGKKIVRGKNEAKKFKLTSRIQGHGSGSGEAGLKTSCR